MEKHALTAAQANLELSLLNAEAESMSSSDLYAWLRASGLPSEAAIRLKGLVEITLHAADRVIQVGKIILIKIIEFIKAHPNLATGLAVGAAIGALVSMVPILGPYLASIAAAIGMTIGAIAGHRLDKIESGQARIGNQGLIEVAQDVIEIAKAFLKSLIEIFDATLRGQVLTGV